MKTRILPEQTADSVWKEEVTVTLLIEKNTSGFNDKSLQLVRSYFEDRLNRVKVGKATSD